MTAVVWVANRSAAWPDLQNYHEQTTSHPAPCDPRPGDDRAVFKCTIPTTLRNATVTIAQAFSASGCEWRWQADSG